MEHIIVNLFNLTKGLLRLPLIAVGEDPENLSLTPESCF